MSVQAEQDDELRRFFAEAAPRLETAQALDDELDRQLARRFNVFDYLRTDELGFSRMIADLLDPGGKHGQGAAFLKLFVEKLEFAKNVDVAKAKVQTELEIHRGRRIDIVVEINDEHCLAIENKSNYAADQVDQVKDYLSWLKKYANSLLVYLSPHGDGPKEESVSLEVLEREAQRFAILPCAASDALNDDFKQFRRGSSLVDWLADCRRNCDVDRLRWYLREVETYCLKRYGGSAVTDLARSKVKCFVRSDKRNVATASKIHAVFPEIEKEIKINFLDLIGRTVKFHLNLEGMGDFCYKMEYEKQFHRRRVLIFATHWKPYRLEDFCPVTSLGLESASKTDDRWYIGVRSPDRARIDREEIDRRDKLGRELRDKLGMEQTPWWPCGIESGEHGWNDNIGEIHEEVEQAKQRNKNGGEAIGGEITRYYVEELMRIAVLAVPRIDLVDGNAR